MPVSHKTFRSLVSTRSARQASGIRPARPGGHSRLQSARGALPSIAPPSRRCAVAEIEDAFSIVRPSCPNSGYRARAMATTVFSKILSGEIPSLKVYEDDLVFAFSRRETRSAKVTRWSSPRSPRRHSTRSPTSRPPLSGASCRGSAARCSKQRGRASTTCFRTTERRAPGRDARALPHHPKPDSSSGLGVGWPKERAGRRRQGSCRAHHAVPE